MSNTIQKIHIPDIGGARDVEVIEILVKPGDSVAAENPLITLEGDKATMEIPAPIAGVVQEIFVKIGDKVSEGSLILSLSTTETVAAASSTPAKSAPSAAPIPVQPQPISQPVQTATSLHAGPAVRRLAYELGIDLAKINATGPKGRVTKEDLQNYIKVRLQAAENSLGFSLPPAPVIDFAKFGDIETQLLSKIKKSSGANLHRNWVQIPHVTQFDEADITDLEAFRVSQKEAAAKQNVRLTPLIFIMKAVVETLKAFPHFNASLDPNGQQLILKKYFHLGVAVDTPNGLVVPVIRNVDRKDFWQLAKELGDISEKARKTGLSMADMQGGCFTISSLGGIGGTAFTPIINAPEVAILGVSRSQQKPVYDGKGGFNPRLMLPLSLSYDHRVIDGADGARFVRHLAECLTNIKKLIE